MVDDGDDTQAFRPIEDTQAHEAIPERAISDETVVEEPPPPSGPPPRAVIDDIWPWLALLAGLAVAALLVWLFVLRDDNSSKQTVPAVVGLQQQEAIQRLNADGYDVKAILGPAKKPQGIVVAQSPGGGSQLPKGSNVTLHVSNGTPPPAATTTTTTTNTTTTTHTTTQSTTTVAAPTSQVPDVSNTDLATAEGQIEAAGFVSEADPVDGSGTAGTVQDQTPSAGSQAPAGSVVQMSVVRGSGSGSVTVPDVVGRSGADARAALAQAKLTYKTVYKKGKPGIVLAQSPTGTQTAYTQVVLTVGQ